MPAIQCGGSRIAAREVTIGSPAVAAAGPATRAEDLPLNLNNTEQDWPDPRGPTTYVVRTSRAMRQFFEEVEIHEHDI
jgi:hypothetical protein